MEEGTIRSYEIELTLSVTPKSNDGRYQSSYTAYQLRIAVGDLREHGQKASEFLSEQFKRFVELQNEIEKPKIMVKG